MIQPGGNRKLGPFLQLKELDQLLRRSERTRVVAAAVAVVSYPALAFGAWIFGPWSPAGFWYPTVFIALLLAFLPLTVFSARVVRVLSGAELMPTDDERKRTLLAAVRVAKYPVDVCTECCELFEPASDGACPTCRQRFTVMRVSGEREVRRLDTLLLGPPSPGA